MTVSRLTRLASLHEHLVLFGLRRFSPENDFEKERLENQDCLICDTFKQLLQTGARRGPVELRDLYICPRIFGTPNAEVGATEAVSDHHFWRDLSCRFRAPRPKKVDRCKLAVSGWVVCQ
jgi:hypothetical protein